MQHNRHAATNDAFQWGGTGVMTHGRVILVAADVLGHLEKQESVHNDFPSHLEDSHLPVTWRMWKWKRVLNG